MKRYLLACSSLLLAAPSFAADAPIKEGRWQYTMQMDMPDMPKLEIPSNVQLPPGMKMPQMGPHGMTMSYERCVTKDDLVPRNEKGSENCSVTKQTRRGNSIEWAVSCDTPQGKMQGEGTATYTGDSMTSKMHMTGSNKGRPIDITQTINGRYLGACTP